MSAHAVAVAVVALAIVIAIIASLHAVLYKRDVRAAIGWAGFIWVAPFLGALSYALFGVNRIRRRAAALRPRPIAQPPWAIAPALPAGVAQHLAEHIALGDRVCGNTTVPGNHVTILDGGARCFPSMLDAIDSASRFVALSTYIFEKDATGQRFVAALSRAAARGVEVRVLLDAVGSRRSQSYLMATLRNAGVLAETFLPPRAPISILSINLRNHRKLLVVDGVVAFTGGANISDDYWSGERTTSPIRDVHFRIAGPIVADLYRVFIKDWLFTTGERLQESEIAAVRGDVRARIVADGPDEDFEQTRWLILGAIAAARQSIRICTPYFLPDISLITALGVAALRGVRVEILIPETLDHPPVKWASNALLWQVLEKGCRIWFTPPPFDHSKLLTVDGAWTLFGSSNWDARSMRLNFEVNVEAFTETLTHEVEALIEERRTGAREVTLAMMDARSLPMRIRDGLARLFVPYL